MVASAITDKGVTTANDATFAVMANNISSIKQLDTSDATAAAGQILTGYSAYVKGSKINGSMTNQGAKISNLNCGDSYTIPAGYHDGSGKITANSLASQTSATATAADIASGKTAWIDGTKLTGNMTKISMKTVTVSNTTSWTLPELIGVNCFSLISITGCGTIGIGSIYVNVTDSIIAYSAVFTRSGGCYQEKLQSYHFDNTTGLLSSGNLGGAPFNGTYQLFIVN